MHHYLALLALLVVGTLYVLLNACNTSFTGTCPPQDDDTQD